MEFPELIVGSLLAVCCTLGGFIAGLAGLLVVRFSYKDKLLARNILLTVLIACLVAFAIPLLELAWGLVGICRYCPQLASTITPALLKGMLLETLQLSAGSLVPGSAVGFLIAYAVVSPITVLVRRRRSRRGTADLPLPASSNEA
jgi:hypothetical protein